jgi:hypothetical protein
MNMEKLNLSINQYLSPSHIKVCQNLIYAKTVIIIDVCSVLENVPSPNVSDISR